MFFFQSKSMQLKMLLLNAIIVLGVGAGVVYEVRVFTQEREQEILHDFRSVAEMTNQAIQAQFFERYGDIQAFALNPQVQAKTAKEVEEALNAYVMLYGIYDLILVADLNGRIVGVNTKAPSGRDLDSTRLYGRSVADTEWFRNVLAGKFTEDKANGFAGTYVEDVHVDALVSEIYREKRLGNGFTALLKDKTGKPIGVISNRAGSRWFESEFEHILEAAVARGYPSSDITLMDKDGTVMSEAFPGPDGKVSISRDFDVIDKFNLVEAGVGPAVRVVKGRESGSDVSFHARKKTEVLAGYTPIEGKKWASSLHWFVLARESKDVALSSITATKRAILLVLGVMFLVALAFSFYFSRSLAASLRAIASGLASNAQGVNQVAGELAEGSNRLSASATKQATALQETAASVDEVSSMVSKNADNAKRSQEVSASSAETVARGKVAVSDVIRSMDEINGSNREIVSQIEEGNKQLAEIVKVINGIGEKTKVINDIVFQTKLLSFNASVEAARAGEHGKGFAVVAEEVGNLASMSGNAAKEISDMLGASISQVEQIVASTQERVGRLTVLSKEKVEVGTLVAKRCGDVLEEIVEKVQEVNGMVAEIATASGEQAQGVVEINKAVNQLDEVTQANASASQETASSAERLRSQSDLMSNIVQKLMVQVEGAAAQSGFREAADLSVESDPAPEAAALKKSA